MSYDCSLQPSEALNLAEYPRRVDDIKPITEDFGLNSPHTVNLCDFQVDDPGAKYSSVNKSWNHLEELKFYPHSLLQDLTIEDLDRDRVWNHFKRLLLWDCNTDKLAIKCWQFNELLNSYSIKGYSVNREEKFKKQDTELSREFKRNFIRELKEVPPALIMQSLKPDKRRFHDLRNLDNEINHNTGWLLRGGLPETQSTNSEYRGLLIKLEQYKERVLSKNNDERELRLYIEPLTRSKDHKFPELNDEDTKHKERNRPLPVYTEPLDPLKDLRKQFLTSDKTIRSQVLLLTGQAGSGKSVFCRRLWRDLLAAWSSSLTQEIEDDLWFPIYIDCTLMKEFETDAITKILKNELSLEAEEGIKIMQNSELCNTTPLNILIIFDGCDMVVQKLLEELLMSEFDRDKCNIPHIIGAEKYKTVKILITCREESLQGVKRRELLFAPAQHEEQFYESSNSRKLFLQRRIEPFSDEQITMYLIKCCFHGSLETSNKTEIQEGKGLTQPSNLLSSSSWATVKNYESMIDSYALRVMARTPFMLKVIVEVLSSIVTENISKQAPLRAKTLTAYHLIEQFIDRAIQLNAQQRLAALTRTNSEEGANELEKAEVTKNLAMEIRQQLQTLALKLSGYSSKTSISLALEINVERSVLESNSLIEWNENDSRLRFKDSLIMDFLVANQIKEELIYLTAVSLAKEKPTIQKEILLNQRLLNLRAALQNLNIRIICDAVKDKRIPSDLLLKIIDLSRQVQKSSESLLQMKVEDEELQMKDEKQEESKHGLAETAQQQSNQLITEKELNDNITKGNYLQSYFGIAAANAITILNMTGFNFSSHDLSNICIKGANLSYGIFERTNFANAKLQRVVFTSAWLKDANLETANLQGADFGEDSDLKIQDDFITGISYSRNGRYLAVDTYDQTVIYENLGSNYSSFKKIKNFPRKFSTIKRFCPFSNDNKQIATISANQISIWDIESGELREKFGTNFKTVLGISPDMDYAVFDENKNIQVYSVEERFLSMNLLSIHQERDGLTNCDANFSQSSFFVLGVRRQRGLVSTIMKLENAF